MQNTCDSREFVQMGMFSIEILLTLTLIGVSCLAVKREQITRENTLVIIMISSFFLELVVMGIDSIWWYSVYQTCFKTVVTYNQSFQMKTFLEFFYLMGSYFYL